MGNKENKELFFNSCRATAFVALAVFSVLLCGAETGLQLTVSLTVAYSVAAWLLGRHSASKAGKWVLFVVAVVMTAGVVLNVWEYTSVLGGTAAYPVLNNIDASRFFRNAAEFMTDGTVSSGRFTPGMIWSMAALWCVFGKSIVYPLALNVMLTLIAVVLSGSLSRILLADKASVKHSDGIFVLAMALTAAVCHFLGQGMVLLKEPMVYVGFLMTIIVLARLYKGRRMTASQWVQFVTGCVLLSSVRSSMLMFVGLLMLLLLRHAAVRRMWVSLLAMAAVMVVCYVGASHIQGFGYERHVSTIKGSGYVPYQYLCNPRYDGYMSIVGRYMQRSPIEKIALLPVTVAVQAAIPFPWTMMRDVPFGYSQIWNHIALPWYLLAGILLFYFAVLWWRRATSLRLWALWALLCWVITAYLYAGTVSRYVMPVVPMLVPLAVYVIEQIRSRRFVKTFKVCACGYSVLLVLALTASYFIQMRS